MLGFNDTLNVNSHYFVARVHSRNKCLEFQPWRFKNSCLLVWFYASKHILARLEKHFLSIFLVLWYIYFQNLLPFNPIPTDANTVKYFCIISLRLLYTPVISVQNILLMMAFTLAFEFFAPCIGFPPFLSKGIYNIFLVNFM